MAPEPASPADREQVLDEILTAYLKAVDAGRPPDRRELLARHSDLAPDLERFFADQDAIGRWTEPLHRPDLDTPHDAAGCRPGPPLGSFGDYELLGVLGRGGMGTVYKARQRSLNRLVALKVIRAGAPAGPAEGRRFRTEAEVVAGLEHPNIVPVHEVGEHDGLLYLSMRLVEGGTLAERLERFTADPRAAARLVADVARAVHFAHQRGVLHRDLKPGNILLDGDGRPLVTDFGLARRVESDSSLTQSGAIVGTPSYMAPEQASGTKGAVTTAADVWGLGALLYALLTGRPPFRGETALETLEQVKGRDPEPPRRLNPRVGRDLETVCLKCLQKDPARRYGSAVELADDLGRWLAGEPVKARRVSPWERAHKWVRRRPALAALLAVAAVSAAALLAGAVWSDARLRAAADRERRQAERATRERDAARQAIDDMYTQVAERWLARQPRLQPLQREFLEKALAYYQRATETDDPSPEARLELGRAYVRVGKIQIDLGSYPAAEQPLRQAAGILEELSAAGRGGREVRSELGTAWGRLGAVLHWTGRDADAREAARKAVALHERLVGDGQASAADRGLLAGSYIVLGQALEGAGDLPGAEGAFRKAVSLQEELVAGAPDAPEHQANLARTMQDLGRVLFATQRFQLGLEAMERGAAVAERAAKADPTAARYQMSLASLRLSLGMLYSKTHQLRKAEAALQGVPEAQTRLVSDYPDVAKYREELGLTYNMLGIVYEDLGRPRDAEKAYRDSIEIKEKLAEGFQAVPLYREDLVQSLNNLTLLLIGAGRLPEAERVNGNARRHAERLVKDFPDSAGYQKDLARTRQRRAEIELAAGRPAAAAAEWEQALAASSHPDIRDCAAEFLASCPDPKYRNAARATALARENVRTAPENSGYWETLGLALYRANDPAEAVKALEQARQAGSTSAGARLLLAMARWKAGDRDGGRREYAAAREQLQKGAAPDAATRALMGEAAALLGIKEAPPPKGKD